MLALCTGVNLIPAKCHWSIAKTQQQYNHLSLKDVLILKVCALQCTFTWILDKFVYTHINILKLMFCPLKCCAN